jgi:flagellar basal-body rod protein FlgG
MPTRALRTAASGMFAQQVNIEVISNNIANVNTNGFKKNKAEFEDLMYQEVQVHPQTSPTPGIEENSSNKIMVGNGVQNSSTDKIFKQGDIVNTNNQLDMAIQGDGFFQIRKPDGSYVYTRDGSFKLNADGEITTNGGLVLEPGLTVDQNVTSLSISKDGTVEAEDTGGGKFVLGNIELVKFLNPAGLKPLGDNLYSETDASGAPLLGTPGQEGFGDIHQGFLESSNVDIVEEMIAMIAAQRAYEMNSKTVQTVEDMMSTANNLKR